MLEAYLGPAGAMLAIAFVHNLLRRHPACTVLLHRQPSEAQPGAGASAATSELSSIANGQDTSGSAVSQNGQGDQPDEQETEKAAKRRKNAVQHGANRASAQQCNGNPAGNSTPVSANAAQHHSSATAAHELSMEHAPEQQQQQVLQRLNPPMWCCCQTVALLVMLKTWLHNAV